MRENEYDVPVIAPDFIPLERLTYHTVPGGRFDSEKVTVKTFENIIDSETGLPLTVNDPEDGNDPYVLSDVAIVYEYVPLGSENDIVLVVDENVWPLLRFTYHVDPEGRPDSIKVTL